MFSKYLKSKYENLKDIHIHKYIERIKNKMIKYSQGNIFEKEISDRTLKVISKYYQKEKTYIFQESNPLRKKIKNIELTLHNKKLMISELDEKNKILHKMQNYESKKISSRFQTKKLKLETRIKELNKMIKVESISRKIYLSDEPPLNSIGWLKLVTSYLLILFWILIILWPVYELIKATVNGYDSQAITSNGFEFTMNNFKYLFEKTNYTNWLTNTLVIASITSILTIMTTLMIGYAYSRFRFTGKKTSLMIIMLLQMIPAFAALTVFFILNKIIKQTFGFDGKFTLILIYVGGSIAGNTFIMKGYMDSISKEIDEAARIDGLSQWRIFVRIIIPLTKPIIAIIGLWSFIGPFGDILLPSLLIDNNKDYTVATGLRLLVSDKRDLHQPAYAAGAVIVAIPISILFISLRKFFVGALVKGGVKG